MIAVHKLAAMTDSGRERLARVTYAIAVATLKQLKDAGETGQISQPSFDRLIYKGEGSPSMLLRAENALKLPAYSLEAVLNGDLAAVLGMDFSRNQRAREIIIDALNRQLPNAPQQRNGGLFSNGG